MRLQVEGLAGADGAEIGFLYQIFRALGVARESAGDAVQRVELVQRERLELFTRRFQKKRPGGSGVGCGCGAADLRSPNVGGGSSPKYPNASACLGEVGRHHRPGTSPRVRRVLNFASTRITAGITSVFRPAR